MERSKAIKRPRESNSNLQLRKYQQSSTIVTLTLEQLQKIVETAVEKKLKEILMIPCKWNSDCSYIS